jgi:hypothetical protein
MRPGKILHPLANIFGTCVIGIAAFSDAYAHAEIMNVGRKSVDVPAPAGFTRVTSSMPRLNQLLVHIAEADPLNDTLAVYIPTSSALSALEGRIPEFDRYFILKVNKKLKGYSVSKPQFAGLQDAVESQYVNMHAKLNGKIGKSMGLISDIISDQYKVDFVVKSLGSLPLGIHEKGVDHLAYSVYSILQTLTAKQTNAEVICYTATMIDVSGQVLLMFAYGARNDLSWTRISSSRWRNSIMSRNDR